MKSEELMLKVENVSKIYRLGEIGGTTLRDELQRLKAKVLHREDPTKKIGAKNYNKGEKFKALDNISFEVKKGERIGIIGHNGAGKSTLLKLISRVTGPSEGMIYLNGRVASMLEVGTGFHPELTGRENVYMNGAILGMTKKEIDAKMEDIIEFSEVRQFIDTPVKRYSSGMYVKLAFSVAAHLDSEIMIMDEVLAVGDVAFQNKCISKMKDVSEQEDKTILYVSHNMNTVRKLCNRVIVLKRGAIIYDGDVETGIAMYYGKFNSEYPVFYDLKMMDRPYPQHGKVLKIDSFRFDNPDGAVCNMTDKLSFSITFRCFKKIEGIRMYITFVSSNGTNVGTAESDDLISCEPNNNYVLSCSLDVSCLTPDTYVIHPDLFAVNKEGNHFSVDRIFSDVFVKIIDENDEGLDWNNMDFGNIKLPKIKRADLEGN